MIKLMKLEIQRIDLRPYLISSAIIGVVLLAFTYFIAYVAQVEQEVQFMNYDNIFLFTNLMGGLLFGVLSATMYTKLIIEEYAGKRLALLFSYPVGRRKTFTAKVLLVFLFVVFFMTLCTMLRIFIFFTTESLSPIVSDVMTSDILIKALGTMVVTVVAVSAIGLLAMNIGFIKKSVSITIISGFVLSGIYGNIAAGSVGDLATSSITIGVSLLVILVVYVTLSNKINHMEAE